MVGFNKTVQKATGVSFFLVLLILYLVHLNKKPCLTEEITRIRKIEDISVFLDAVACPGKHMEILHRIYDIKVTSSYLRIPVSMKAKVSDWMSGDSQLIKQIDHQRVVQVRNKFTNEATHFNPLRARRPNVQASEQKPYLENLIEKSREDCDFCNPENNTAEEVWGRIRTGSSISAANLFRMVGPYNAIIIPNKHSILDIRLEDLWDMFSCAKLWFQKINSNDPFLNHGMLVWDMFPRAGASQIHSHLQVFMDSEFIGQYKTNYLSALNYRSAYNSEYWDDVIDLHSKLGLGTRVGDTYALTLLNSHKDNEVVIIGKKVNEDFISLLYAVIQIYQKNLRLYCLSLGMSWPILNSNSSYPAVLRIATRGDCSSPFNDVSSVELFSFYNINTDPFRVIKLLRKKILGD